MNITYKYKIKKKCQIFYACIIGYVVPVTNKRRKRVVLLNIDYSKT